MADNDWVTPGAEAVILQPYDQGALQAKTVQVDRVLKRDVVLSDGSRFRVDTLEKSIGGTWGTRLYLVPPDDPRVTKTRIKIRGRRLRSEALGALDSWRNGTGTARDVADRFADLAQFEASN